MDDTTGPRPDPAAPEDEPSGAGEVEGPEARDYEPTLFQGFGRVDDGLDDDLPEPWEPWEPWSAAPVPAGHEPTEDRPPRARQSWRLIAVGLVSAVVGAALGLIIALTTLSGPEEAAAPTVTVVERVETRIVEVPADTGATPATEIARQVLPAVVVVEQGSLDGNSFFRSGGGSGVVIDADGHIVTNHHVVDGADAHRVIFSDGRIVPATLVGSDPLTDLAVLAVDVQGLMPISLGSTADLAVGDTAYAVGNPLTLDGGPSMSSGVVSAMGRTVSFQGSATLVGMLQTDAPITRGSSGGALVDARGLLIGITTAVGVSDLGQEGIGFAIPVELVRRVTEEIVETGAVSHAFLGIEGTTHFAEEEDGSTLPAGVAVGTVLEGTAADLVGLMPGDVIVGYRGEALSSMDQLVARLRLSRVGEQVTVELIRDGEAIVVELELMARPEGP